MRVASHLNVIEDERETVQRAPQKHNHLTYALPVISVLNSRSIRILSCIGLRYFSDYVCLTPEYHLVLSKVLHKKIIRWKNYIKLETQFSQRGC